MFWILWGKIRISFCLMAICMLPLHSEATKSCKDGGFSTSDDDNKLHVYNVEHEVSAIHAKAVASVLHPDQFEIPAGCKPCTRKEMQYCDGTSLMNDHCCCDRRFEEVFPHIPHTCYMGEELCKPILRDCAEYARLRECCCDRYVALKWKALSNGTAIMTKYSTWSGLLLLLTVILRLA